MTLSAFGMPIPEEVVLISAGFVGYAALHPDRFPPPFPGAESVNVYTLALVAFLAVIAADFLIYHLGHRFGPRIFKMKFFARVLNEEALAKIQRWTKKYGYWAVIIFRFTPGIRFPGHLMCGAMGMSRLRFIGVDAIAAGLSVPTQVLLVSFYGEYILQYFTQFKIWFFSILGVLLVALVIHKILQRRRNPHPALGTESASVLTPSSHGGAALMSNSDADADSQSLEERSAGS
jgi:membrane protein DedA with SNARE-associated domain